MMEDAEEHGRRDLRRVSQWCVAAWVSIVVGACGFIFSGTVTTIGGGILVMAGFLFSFMSAFLALLGILFPGGAGRLRFIGLLALSMLPFVALRYFIIPVFGPTIR